jgi:catechol 2,3-dioxygenase-like lactoylglutathione lyase family enzyme
VLTRQHLSPYCHESMGGPFLTFRSVDHVGLVVSDLGRSIEWWTAFLLQPPFEEGIWLASETDDYIGRIVGYQNCDLSAAFWTLPGGTVLEMIQYHNPPTSIQDMETYNIGNTHLCLETSDIDADYSRLKGRAEFRSSEPVTSVRGPYKGARICYLRDPDGITIELVEFASGARPFERQSPYSNPYESQLGVVKGD